jgi:hypothetical protein
VDGLAPAGYLDDLRARRINVTLIDTEPTPTRPPRRRWPIITAAAAAMVAVIVGGLVLAARDDADDPQIPAAPNTTAAPPVTEEPVTTPPPPLADESVAVEEPDASLFIVEATDVTLWMLSDPVALVASPPGDELVSDPQVGGSVDELVAWLVGHPELDTSEPEPVSIGGLDGSQVDVAISPGSTSRSPSCESEGVCVDVIASPDLNWYAGQGPDHPFSRRILLATPEGGTVVLSLYPKGPLVGDQAGFHERAELLIDSLAIDFIQDVAGPGRTTATKFRPAFSYTGL